MFSKDAGQAKPIEQARPIEQASPPAPEPDSAKPAEQAKPAVAAPSLAAEDTAVADRLKELVESKLQPYVPREQDRAGVLAFYKARNFAPLWIASGKPAPRAEHARRS